MEALYAAALGAIQGISEFLPISSSAHLIVFSKLVGGETLPLSLNVAMHLGTFFAAFLYFWKDWQRIFLGLKNFSFNGSRSFESHVLVPAIVVGTIPAAAVGLLLKEHIESIFHHPQATIAPLIFVGLGLWIVDERCKVSRNFTDLKISDAFLIGICQAIALIPGTSRSGATILGARVLGFSRSDSARFSFVLGAPAMAGAALIESSGIWAHSSNPIFYIGILTSFFVGLTSIHVLLIILQSYGFLAFAIYRCILAGILIAVT